MKYLFIILCCLVLQNVACNKNKEEVGNCNAVTITNTAPGCGGWGIVVSGTKYPSANIPSEFQQDGITVCSDYELYVDARLCACCGGTWANIKSMKRFVR
jgi:hypothetical protein